MGDKIYEVVEQYMDYRVGDKISVVRLSYLKNHYLVHNMRSKEFESFSSDIFTTFCKRVG